MRYTHFSGAGKNRNPDKITEKNQRTGAGTEAESRLPWSELHLQLFSGGVLRRLRITGRNDGSRFNI